MFTVEDVNNLFGYEQGEKLMSYLSGTDFAQKEFFVDGDWMSSAKGEVEGTRYLVEERDKLDEVGKIWSYLTLNSKEKPSKPDTLLRRIADARFNDSPLNVVIPWGDKEWGELSLEKEPLGEINRLFQDLSSFGLGIYIIVMSEKYVPSLDVRKSCSRIGYFELLEEAFADEMEGVVSVDFKPWSQIKRENQNLYERTSEELDWKFDSLLTEGWVQDIRNYLSEFSSEYVWRENKKYCLEKKVGSIVLDELFSPVKISMIQRLDDGLDRLLPTMYYANWNGSKD